MTAKVTYFEDYSTHINVEISMRLEEEQSAQYLLIITKNGCQIKRVN